MATQLESALAEANADEETDTPPPAALRALADRQRPNDRPPPPRMPAPAPPRREMAPAVPHITWDSASMAVHRGDSTIAGSERRGSDADPDTLTIAEDGDAVATLHHLQGLLGRMRELRDLSRSLGISTPGDEEADANVEGRYSSHALTTLGSACRQCESVPSPPLNANANYAQQTAILFPFHFFFLKRSRGF